MIGISAENLNRGCVCRSLDPERLRRELDGEPFLAGLADDIAQSRPHLFASSAVFISGVQYGRMAKIVAAIEQVAAIPAYRDAALVRAPSIAHLDPGPRGGRRDHISTNDRTAIDMDQAGFGKLP